MNLEQYVRKGHRLGELAKAEGALTTEREKHMAQFYEHLVKLF